jgi:hypothetical protein
MTLSPLPPPPSRDRAIALALMVAAHLALGALWFAGRAPVPRSDDRLTRAVLLMLLPARAASTPPPRAAVAVSPPPTRRVATSAARAITAPPVPDAALDSPLPPPVAPPSAVPTQADSGAEPLRQRALRGAAQVARELMPATARDAANEPASLRLARLMENAHVDRSLGTGLERRVSPDGVVVTRVRRNGGVTCYMSGAVNFVPGILHDSARPQTVNCPPEKDGWSRQ